MCYRLFILASHIKQWSDLYSKAVGAEDPASISSEEAVVLQGLQYNHVMASEVCIFQGVFLDQF